MSILSKDTIIKEILPHLSISNKGRKLSQERLVGIVQLILFRLKTGTQWRELPVKQFLDEPYNWRGIFHHFNRWCKDGSWKRTWTNQVMNNKSALDLSSAQLDGTHTTCKRGGQAVGYQGRKACHTTNMLCISDANGVLLAASQPVEGNRHDLFNIEKHFQEMVDMLYSAGISVDGLFLNADAGFDSTELRNICDRYGIIPNFYLNTRNAKTAERNDWFDPLLYKQRVVIEHSFAWMDAFKALLIRFETSARNWFNLNIIGFLAIFAKKKKNLF